MLVFDAFVTRVMYREAFLTRGGVRISFEHSKIFSDGQTASALPPHRDSGPGRCQQTAATIPEPSRSSPRIQLNRRAIVGLYLSKCKEASAQLPELLKAMTIIEDMERIATNDRASIEELVSYERYGKQLAAEFPNDQQIQDQRLMEEHRINVGPQDHAVGPQDHGGPQD